MRYLLIIFMTLFVLSAMALDKPTIAVYVASDNDPLNELISNRLMEILLNSGKYVPLERSADLLQAIKKEIRYQHTTGNVDQEQIALLGRQNGADYVCAVYVRDVFDKKYIISRIIDTEKAAVIVSCASYGLIDDNNSLGNILNNLSGQFAKLLHKAKKQDSSKVAVYIYDSDSPSIDIVIEDQLVAGFANNENYTAVERTDKFLKLIQKEIKYQHLGEVDDNQWKFLGKQYGVPYICVTKLTKIFDMYNISTRLINVETAETSKIFNVESIALDSIKDIVRVTQNIVENLTDTTILENGTIQWQIGTYVGQLLNGKPHGKGTVYSDPNHRMAQKTGITVMEGNFENGVMLDGTWKYKNGAKYVGKISGYQKNGKGVYYFAPSDIRYYYEGEFKDGKMEGYGTLVYKENYDVEDESMVRYKKYKGEFKNNKFNGYGSLYYEDGYSRHGYWVDGVMNSSFAEFRDSLNHIYFAGEVENNFPKNGHLYDRSSHVNEKEYIGDIKYYEPHGVGTLYYTDGTYYYGQFVDGSKHGKGKQTYSSEYDFYDGEWEYGTWSGYGTLVFKNGDKYVGQFSRGNFEGKGTYYFKNGDKYVGQFRRGQFEGEGTYYVYNPMYKLIGEWKDGKKNGKFIFYDSSGSTQVCYFENDNLIEQ